MDFWILRFLGFWVLQLCFRTVETDPKLDSEKGRVCVGIYSVFKGCACRRWVTRYIYICTYIYIYMYICTCICTCIRTCISRCIHTLGRDRKRSCIRGAWILRLDHHASRSTGLSSRSSAHKKDPIDSLSATTARLWSWRLQRCCHSTWSDRTNRRGACVIANAHWVSSHRYLGHTWRRPAVC